VVSISVQVLSIEQNRELIFNSLFM